MSKRRLGVLLAASRNELQRLETLVPEGLTATRVASARDLEDTLQRSRHWMLLVGTDGFELGALSVAQRFRERVPFAPMLLYVDEPTWSTLEAALRLVAHAVRRDDDFRTLAPYLKWWMNRASASESDILAAFDQATTESGLTERERAVLVASSLMGATKREISDVTGVAITTVKTHRLNAASKVGAPGMRELRREMLEQLLKRRGERR